VVRLAHLRPGDPPLRGALWVWIRCQFETEFTPDPYPQQDAGGASDCYWATPCRVAVTGSSVTTTHWMTRSSPTVQPSEVG